MRVNTDGFYTSDFQILVSFYTGIVEPSTGFYFRVLSSLAFGSCIKAGKGP